MNSEMMKKITGQPMLAQEGYTVYGMFMEGRLIVTGVYASDPELLQEVRIPAVIDGAKVCSVVGHFCGNEWETFSVGALHIPDSVENVRLELLKPTQLFLTPTDAPALRLENGLLLTGDGARVLTFADETMPCYAVPEGVTEICRGAFRYCRAEEILLPQSLRVIGDGAFAGARVRRMEIPGGVTSIGNGAFRDSCLKEVLLNDGLTHLGEHAFSRCGLTEVRVPGSVKWIPWGAFTECRRLTRVELAQGVEVIGSYAFEECPALREVILPDGLQQIRPNAFRGCQNLPASLQENAGREPVDDLDELLADMSGDDLGPRAWDNKRFAGDVLMRGPEVTMGARREGDGLILTGVWHAPTGEEPELCIPQEIDGLPVTGIAEDCEVNPGGWVCFGTVTLPDSIDLPCIPWRLIARRMALRATDRPALRVQDGCILSLDGKRLLGVADRQQYACTVPEGVEVIADNAFMNSCVRDVRLPESVREIGENAFYRATLRRITLPQGLRRIGRAAFAETLLDAVTLPEGLTALGAEAFAGSLIRHLILPDSLQEIGTDVVAGCIQLEHVRLPEGLESLPATPEQVEDEELLYVDDDEEAFGFSGSIPVLETEAYTLCGSLNRSYGHTSSIVIDDVKAGDAEYIAEVRIPSIVLDEIVDAIGDGWSRPSVRIGRLVLPWSINRIDHLWIDCVEEMVMDPEDDKGYVIRDGFLMTRDCKMLVQQLRWRDAQVTLPEGVEEIGPHAFAECLVEEITLPQSVTKLGRHAFERCPHLRAIHLSGGVKVLPEDAFRSCDALETVVLPEGLEEVGDHAFDGCKALRALQLPDTLVRLGQDALQDTGLTHLHIPAALTEVSVHAFRNLRLTVAAGHPLFSARDGALCSADGETLLRWCGGEEAIIPAGVKRVETHAFDGCTGLRRVVLPEGLTELADFAFFRCPHMKEIVMPAGVKRIGAGCFSYCRSLTAATLPDGLEEIGNACFEGCLTLSFLQIPQSVRRIGARAFRRCPQLRLGEMPAGLVRQDDGSYEAHAPQA